MRVVVIGAVLAAVLAACGTGTPSAPSAPPAPSTPTATAEPTIVMVIRHGEKPDGSAPGVDAAGKKDDSSLTATGWERAHSLVELFDPAQGPVRPGLARPTAIYAAGVTDEAEGQRTRETVTPLADALGITVDADYGRSDEKKLVKAVVNRPGPTLISWQHGGIPDIARAFPDVTPTPPKDWPDDRFDVVWTFTKAPDGWHFAQLPELLLPQDQTAVIAS